ncbi:pre-piRNA 3'-exonuclease trimmer isoform X3 [Cryptotermes secundus]|uniref:pre-piRNA 3'-exonuclease trimmer isoform X3 n=1 Tax=Cryptotermes secundus TaxID=105785 RepID=UPI000CD7BF86|nr:pre-piRNA 3'-exonuclease trimmer isoform X3 [Cryptotermes secundus]
MSIIMMVEITRNNFEEKYPEIEGRLRSAVFVAVDTEFTGLLSDPAFKPSLFDTGSERYGKLRRSTEHFLIMQVGITAFRFIEDKNKYKASKYTFYVFPRSFASIDNIFMCQSSSLEFLCQNHFDFNKFVYDGVPYLNQKEEAHLRKELSKGSLFHQLDRTVDLDDEKSIQLVCSRVAKWAASAVQGDTLDLNNLDICQGDIRLSYVMHKELRQRFPDIWSFPEGGLIRVKKISHMQRKALEENEEQHKTLEETVMHSLLGFSRLFKLLTELKKPIVGHNILLDLMIMYNQFHEQLPTRLNDFKEEIHRLFPVIYDTKFLSFQMRKILIKEDMWNSNILSHLYCFFKEGRGRYLVLYSPIIELEDGAEICNPKETASNVSEQSQDLNVKFHEAGWDSYCTGYCFIRMAHIFAHVTCGSLVFGRILTSREHLLGVSSKKNCVNVIRANISHMCLDGPDPPSDRPNWLHVQAKGFRTIDVSKVAELFARYGSVDVKPFTRFRALVAVGNHGSAKDIVRQFQKHKELRVSYYHPLWHSSVFQTFLGEQLGKPCSWKEKFFNNNGKRAFHC